jgi:NitT/TauT family transport system substrate-binding protein
MHKLLTSVMGAALAIGLFGVNATMAQDLKKVTYAIATADLNVGYPFATLAKQLGYFKDEGLDVDIVPGQSSAATTQILLTGRADIGVAQPNAVMVQRAISNIPLLSFYASSRHATNVFVVKPDSPIQSVKDLKGKKIGVADLGAGTVNYLNSRLKQEGMSPKDVEMVSTGYGTPGYEALKNGTVDASITFSGGVARAVVAGYEVRTLPQPESEKDWYSYNLFAQEDYIKNNPDIIKGIGRATAKATVYLKNNPEAAVRAFWAYSPDRAPKDLNDKAAMERDLAILKSQIHDMAADELPDDFKWGSQDIKVYAKMQDYLVEAGDIKEAKDPSIYFTDEFADAYNDFDKAAIAAASKAAN